MSDYEPTSGDMILRDQMKPWVPCDYCGKPGYKFPVAHDQSLVRVNEEPWIEETWSSVQACEEHKQLVLLRAERVYAPKRFARER